MPDDAQPQEGQGASPFDSYLESVPQDAPWRDQAVEWGRDTSKGVNQMFEEKAALEKRWEPYAQLEQQGVQLPPPDQLAELLQWSNQNLQSQETFDQWVTAIAEEKGLTRPEAEAEAEAQEAEGINPQQIQQTIQEQMQPALTQQQELAEEVRELRMERGTDLETESMKTELGRLEQENKLTLNEKQRGAVIELAMPFAPKNAQGEDIDIGDASWLKQGFDRFKEIGTEANRAFVEEASGKPAAAVTAGGYAASKPVTSFEEAAKVARERFRQELANR